MMIRRIFNDKEIGRILFNKNINYIRNFIIYSFFFFIGFYFINLTGEMDLGPVSLYIKDNILCGVLFVF